MTTYRNTSEHWGDNTGGLTLDDYRRQAEIFAADSREPVPVLTADDEHIYANGQPVADAERPVEIIAVREYYGAQTDCCPVWDDEARDVRVFDSITDAQEWIDEQEDQTYHLSHNEAGRPDYVIVPAGTWEGICDMVPDYTPDEERHPDGVPCGECVDCIRRHGDWMEEQVRKSEVEE